MGNSKRSSQELAKQAARALNDPNASALQRSLAGSVLRQSSSNAQTGASMEEKASRALNNSHSAPLTKALAGSLVSQSNKKR